VIQIPPWLLIVVAVWVIAFGAFRFHLARKKRNEDPDSDRPNFRQSGFYAQSPRRHTVFGALYIVMGGILVAMAFGWKPPILGGCTDEVTPAEKNTETTIEVESTDR
jgi:hypothetical protein